MYIKRPQIRTFLFRYFPIILSIFLFIYLSIYLSTYLSISLSFSFFSSLFFSFSRTFDPFFLCIGVYTRILYTHIYTGIQFVSQRGIRRNVDQGSVFFFYLIRSCVPGYSDDFSKPLMTSLEKGRAILSPYSPDRNLIR